MSFAPNTKKLSKNPKIPLSLPLLPSSPISLFGHMNTLRSNLHFSATNHLCHKPLHCHSFITITFTFGGIKINPKRNLKWMTMGESQNWILVSAESEAV
ncbi:uncharacterized protein DS421_11g327820 [Arachis hypogaea]|nr:uncharacterized protein DS421_11g327820 [Arachis hypogaea]